VNKEKTNAKNLHHSISAKKPATKVSDQYKDLFVLRERPISDAFIERLAYDLVVWAVDNDDALKLSQFILDKRIYPKTFYSWTKRYQVLEMAKEVALEAIGNRREIGAITGKYNVNIVMSQMAKYDQSWWSLEERRTRLKAKVQQKVDTNTHWTIVLEDFGDKNKEKDHLPIEDGGSQHPRLKESNNSSKNKGVQDEQKED